MAALGFVFYQAEPALASNVAVSPVNIYLTRDNPSALLTLTNQGSESVSFALSLYAWNQSETGAIELATTSDIVFFPSLLTLAPGEGRKIRIGTALHPGEVEKTYRIFLEELPSPRSQRTEPRMQVRLLSNISLPIFLEPDKPRFETTIGDVTVHKGELSFHLNNTGSVHVVPSSVGVAGHDVAGNVLFRQESRVWYILAGGSVKVDVALPARSCAKIRTLSISVQIDTETVKKSLSTPSGACVP